MKNTYVLLALLAFTICSCGTNKEASQIYDYENILTNRQERNLNGMILKYQSNTGNEIIILTSKDIGVCQSALQYATIFGKEHGMYSQGHDNNLVIFFSKNMKVTSLATGDETGKSLKDEDTKYIIDSCMIPLFKEEQWFDGIKIAIEESMKKWN